MIAVFDTGPLIALAKVDQLPLTKAMFREIVVPEAVHRELLAKVGPESRRLDVAMQNFIQIRPLKELPQQVRVATMHLDRGEQQAIALACQEQAVLVIDEQLGRAAARALNVRVTGVVGLLISAKKAGHLSAVLPLLREMRCGGYWFSDDLIFDAAKLADESIEDRFDA